MRATAHSGRMGGGRHNDRNFDLDKASHIDSSRTPDNTYFCCYENMTFAEAERAFYDEHFAGMMNDINERAVKQSHLERMTDADKLLASKKTMPEEVIFQIGNKDTAERISPELLADVFHDFHAWHQEKFGDHIKTLNMALHADEATPHIHVRRVWTYEHENGFEAIGQHKALEQMGYELPDPEQPRGRNNNLKMVYSAECREKWLDLCQEHGLQVEREPEHRAPNEQNLQKGDFIIREQERQNRELQAAKDELARSCDSLEEERDTLEGECDTLQGQINSQAESLQKLQGAYNILQERALSTATQCNAGNKELQEVQEQLQNASQELDNVSLKLQEAQIQLQQLQGEEMAAAMERKEKLEAKIEAQRQELKNIKGEVLSAKEVNEIRGQKHKKTLSGEFKLKPNEFYGLLNTAERGASEKAEGLSMKREANAVLQNKEQIINDARQEADRIVSAARGEVDSIQDSFSAATRESKLQKLEKLEKRFPDQFKQMRQVLELEKQQNRSHDRSL